MIISFYDKEKQSINISDERGEKLRQLVNRSDTKFIDIEGHGTFAIGDIKSMVPSKNTRQDKYTLPAHLPPGAPDLTDEQREHKIKKVREIKAAYMAKRRAKQE